MGFSHRQNLWILILLVLSGVLGDDDWKVKYPDPICAIEGSTVTIPCSYRYPQSHSPVRVIWCINHLICQTTTPKLYDSDSTNNSPGLKYLGNKENDCTLQIININKTDSNTYRFRFEAMPPNEHTGQSGVEIQVMAVDNIKLKVTASDDRALKERFSTELSCTPSTSSPCIVNQLEFMWYRNNQALLATGPILHLDPVSKSDSGYYTCGLKRSLSIRSDPYRLQVEVSFTALNKTSIVLKLLIVLAIPVAVAVILIRRRKAEVTNKENIDGVSTLPRDAIYSNIPMEGLSS